MSLSDKKNQLRNVKQEIQEINQSSKELVIQMQLITSTFEGA